MPIYSSVISSRRFLRLWGGTTASGFATWGFAFLLGLAVTQDMLTATEIGVALSVRTIGFLAGVILGGGLADRFGPRLIILWSGLLATTGTALIIPGFQPGQHMADLFLLGGAVIVGLGQGGCRPAYQSLVPKVVATEHRQSANAAISLSLNIALFAGPLFATLLAIYLGLTSAFVVFGAIWLVSAICPPWVDGPDRDMQEARQLSVLNDLRTGFEEARTHAWFLPTLIALSAVIAGGYSITNVILPAISQQATSGPAMLAQCITAYTFGGIAGAFVIGRIKVTDSIKWALVGLATYGLAPLGLFFAPVLLIPMIGYFAAGFGIHVFNILWFTKIQDDVSPDRLARVSSLDFLCSYGLAPLGFALVGPLAQHIGTSAVLWGSAIICIVAPFMAFRFSTARARP